MKRFKLAGQAQRFLSAHDGINNLFHLRRGQHEVPAIIGQEHRVVGRHVDAVGPRVLAFTPGAQEISLVVEHHHRVLTPVEPERWRRREATGDMIMVRYADDTVVGFQHERDARRFRDAMRDRLREFSLSLHPEKTA